MLQRKQVGESIRDLGLEGQIEKAGTPTMGGLIILGAILIPTLLFAELDNIYTINYGAGYGLVRLYWFYR